MKPLFVVTGAGSGIGRCVSLLLAEQGCDLVLAGRTLSKLQDTEKQIWLEHNMKALCVPCDLTEASGVERLSEETRSYWHSFQLGIINCMGVFAGGPLAGSSHEQLAEVMAANAIAPLSVARALLPDMLAAGGGRIINVASIAAVTPFPNSVAYCASKAALVMGGKALAAEVRAQGVQVTAVLPGATNTEIWDGVEGFDRTQMLDPMVVARAIADIALMPLDRNIDEIVITPPKGIL